MKAAAGGTDDCFHDSHTHLERISVWLPKKRLARQKQEQAHPALAGSTFCASYTV